MSLSKREKYLGVFAVSFWLMLIPVTLFITPIFQPVKTSPTLQFESWTAYGSMPYSQGIHHIYIYDNTTGSWVLSDLLQSHEASDTVNASCSVKLEIGVMLNKTLLGFVTEPYESMWNFFRVNISVALGNGTVVYSETNCSRVDAQPDPMGDNIYYGEVETILNFVTNYGSVYYVTIGLDTYW